MHGENCIPAQEVEGLVVQKLDKDAVVELLKAYGTERIPARRNQIPTPEIASKWSYLETITDKIPNMQNKTKLGWGITGPVSPSFLDNQDHVSICHRIITREIDNEKLDRRFVVHRQIREVINPF